MTPMVELRIELGSDLSQVLERVVEKVDSGLNGVRALLLTHRRVEQPVGVAGVAGYPQHDDEYGRVPASWGHRKGPHVDHRQQGHRMQLRQERAGAYLEVCHARSVAGGRHQRVLVVPKGAPVPAPVPHMLFDGSEDVEQECGVTVVPIVPQMA